MPPLRRTTDTKIGLATQLAPDQVNQQRPLPRKEPTDDLELSGDEEDKENDSSEWQRGSDGESDGEDMVPRKIVSKQRHQEPAPVDIWEDNAARDPPNLKNHTRRKSAGQAPVKKVSAKSKQRTQTSRKSMTPALPEPYSDDDGDRSLRGLSPQKSSQILSNSEGEMPPPPVPRKQKSTTSSQTRQTPTCKKPPPSLTFLSLLNPTKVTNGIHSQSPAPSPRWRDESSINRALNETDVFSPPPPTSPPAFAPVPLAAPKPVSRRPTPSPSPAPQPKTVTRSESETRETVFEKHAYNDKEPNLLLTKKQPMANQARPSISSQATAAQSVWRTIRFYLYMAYPLLLRLFAFWFILMFFMSAAFYYGHTEGGYLTSIRQYGMKHNILPWGPMYKAPTSIATTLDEVADRLKLVEEHLEGVHRKVRQDTALLDTVAKKTEDLEMKIESESEHGSEQAQKLSELLKHVQRLDVNLQSQRAQLEKSGKTDIKHKESLDRLEIELKEARERMRKIEDRTAILESGYDDIKKELPQTIALRMDTNGRIQIRPEFLRALQQHIKEKDVSGEVSRLKQRYEKLEKDVGKGDTKLSQGGLSSAEKKKLESELITMKLRVEETERELEQQKKTLVKIQKENAESQYNWKDWLRQNEQGLRSFVNRESKYVVDKNISEGTIVTKETFMQLLKEKAEENAAKLDKKLQNFIDKSMKQRPSSGKAATNILQQQYELLVESPDYAAWSLGSRIDPSVTSPTYFQGGTIARFYHHVFGLDHPPPLPANILIDGTDLGQNWAFPGHTGQVGIILPTKIFPTDIVVSHARFETAVQKDSAPRKCELWVSVRSAEARDRLIAAASEALKTSVQPEPGFGQYYVKIAEFEYEFKEGANQHQVFSVPVSMHNVLGDGNGIEKVIFKVVSNWGHPDWTSLYRVRVHGARDEGSVNGYDAVKTDLGKQQARISEEERTKMAT